MRLRLRIQRNELPTVSVVWPVGADSSRQTVAQFLNRVNERVPLEGNSWGLEDYAVLIGGFEVFHYDEIASVCKDEDEVLIRPLTYVEVRARTLTGRAQITTDGRRLVDGVPFGRPLLKRPSRPDVTIPAPKRQKLELDESGALQDGASEDGGEDDDDEMDDEDFKMDYEDDESGSDDEGEENGKEHDEGSDQEDGSHGKLIRKEKEEGGGKSQLRPRRARNPEHSSSTQELGFTSTSHRRRPESSVEGTTSDTDSSENSSASSSSDSESDSDDNSDSDSSSDTSSEDSDASSSSSESERGRKTVTSPRDTRAGTRKSLDAAGPSTKKPNAPSSADGGLPFQGKAVTQARNRRRTDSKRLATLKRLNKLPPTATIKDMHELFPAGVQKGETNGSASHDSSPVQPPKSSAEKAKELALELEQRRQKLLADIASGGIDVSARAESPVCREKAEAPAEDPSKDADADLDPTEATAVQGATPPVATRRSRLDVASTNRLVFGSLGLRTPRTAEERRQLQEKLEQTTKRRAVDRALPTPPLNSEPDPPLVEDEDAWREKIVLSAVECCDEDVILSAPPFPFEQRWDPQYRTKKKRKSNLFSESKKKRKRQNEQYVETYDKYNTDGNGDALNYDDEEASELDDYWEEGALLDGERGYADDQDAASLQLVTETAIEQAKDDFPDLPADPSILPLLGEADASEGDFVVFTELACSASTAWQPRMVTRTVQLKHKDDAGWVVLLAPRDLPPKQYDNDGNRVYEKFETMDEEDDQDGESSRMLQWGDMSEPRLLLRHADTQS